MMGIVCEGTVRAEAEVAFGEVPTTGYLSGLEGPGYDLLGVEEGIGRYVDERWERERTSCNFSKRTSKSC